MNITFEPLSEIQEHGNAIQWCKVFVDGTELKNVAHRTYFPYSFLKNISVFYSFYGFDCLDKDYQEKLIKFKAIAQKYNAEVIECESVTFQLAESESITGKMLRDIDEEIKNSFTNDY